MNHPLLFVCVLLLSACQSEPPATEHDFRRVTPHAAPTDTLRALSQTDLAHLERAVGKEAHPLTAPQFARLLDPATDALTLLQVYRLDCAACLAMNEHLEAIRNDWSERDLRVVYLNLDPPAQLDAVNLHLRTANLTGPVYQTDPATLRQLTQLDWDGQLPLLVASQPAEAVFVVYQQEFSRAALATVVETLVF